VYRHQITGYFVAILAGFSFGSIPVIIALLRDVGASITEQAFLRLFLGGIAGFVVLLLYYMNSKEKNKPSLTKDIQKTYIWQGLVFTVAIIMYIGSIMLETPVGEAALLIQIHPFVTLILGTILLKEEINRWKIISLILAFLGLIILTQPWEWQSFLTSLPGEILASLNGFFYAIYLLLGASSAKKRVNIPFYLSISWVLFWGLIWGVLIYIFLIPLPFPSTLFDFSFETILTPYVLSLGFLLAILGSTVPYGLIMLSNKYEVESSIQSILLLGEPISAVIMGYFFLSEPITIWYLAGGIPLLLAITLLIQRAITKPTDV
jgi:drug/metabolite transporter (DMT)-like permease